MMTSGVKKCANTIGYIYFIGAIDYDNKVKIGKSQDPNERLSQLQTGNPTQLTIYHQVLLNDYHAAERTLHNICSDLRLVGEWFELTRSELNALITSDLSAFIQDPEDENDDIHVTCHQEIKYLKEIIQIQQQQIRQYQERNESYHRLAIESAQYIGKSAPNTDNSRKDMQSILNNPIQVHNMGGNHTIKRAMPKNKHVLTKKRTCSNIPYKNKQSIPRSIQECLDYDECFNSIEYVTVLARDWIDNNRPDKDEYARDYRDR